MTADVGFEGLLHWADGQKGGPQTTTKSEASRMGEPRACFGCRELESFMALREGPSEMLEGDCIFFVAHNFHGLEPERPFGAGKASHQSIILACQDLIWVLSKALTERLDQLGRGNGNLDAVSSQPHPWTQPKSRDRTERHQTQVKNAHDAQTRQRRQEVLEDDRAPPVTTWG